MAQQKRTHTDDAVSPVIAIMLMLVVTIIIAAVVSSFASGFSIGIEKTPSVILKGTYSVSDGLHLQHTAGDAIPTSEVEIWTKPTKEFGDYDHLSWHIADKSLVFAVPPAGLTPLVGSENKDKVWKYKYSASSSSFFTGVSVFSPGDSIYIHPDYIQPQGDGSVTVSSGSSYRFNTTTNIGKSFIVELRSNGKAFAQVPVQIIA